jgi:hypothetical protein
VRFFKDKDMSTRKRDREREIDKETDVTAFESSLVLGHIDNKAKTIIEGVCVSGLEHLSWYSEVATG